MPADASQTRSTETEAFCFQFTLSTMLIVTTLVAVACSLFFRMPIVPATFALLFVSLALPAVLTTVLIYGHGYGRTFCLGA
ncbi:MAG: hypothetical protein LLG00_09480, partial [Planctomycetaceae bacterium]|nr:hypothetical protein [Planctomycetaceae bacterium]